MKLSRLLLLFTTLCLALTACAGPLELTQEPSPEPSASVAAQLPISPTPTQAEMATEGPSWWQDVVFYEIFVRSFMDSDGDGIGDFQGIISRLDYLNDGDPQTTSDLGVGGIWLMPIFPSPSYHGYDVTDYQNVNPDYGSLQDFKDLLDACHQRGIRVIIDFVINHTSSQHPWFQQAVAGNAGYHDWYVWSPSRPGTPGPWGETAWYLAENGEYYYAPFWSEMPDLNYHNPMVTRAIQNATRFWLDLGVDGFRVDAARYLFEENPALQDARSTIAWFQDWRQYYKSLNPQAFTVGEVWADLQIAAKYNQPSKGMDSLFMFDLAADTLGGVYSPDPSRVIKAYQDALVYFPDGDFSTFLTNHDQQRVASFFSGKLNKEKTAAFIYLTGPGTPFIYYGEEIGMKGKKPDENLRTPMQWSAESQAGFTSGTPWRAVNSDWEETNVVTLAQDPDSLLNWYRSLTALRNQQPALRSGAYLPLISSCRSVYATLRILPGHAPLLAVMNLAAIKAEGCTLSLEGSSLEAGSYSTNDLWGSSGLTAIELGSGGSLNALKLDPTLEGGEGFVLELISD